MTDKKDEALKLALDCVSTLANARDWVGCNQNERWDEDEMYAELCNATICLKKSLSIIQEALAEQPAQQQEVQSTMEMWKRAYEIVCDERDTIVKDADKAHALLRWAETEMRYAAWDVRYSDQHGRADVYEAIVEFLK